MQDTYHLDLVDFYRGTISARRLGVLIRGLPEDSRLVGTLTNRPGRWSVKDLLADLWAITVQANSEKGSLPDNFDHPVRAEMTAKVVAAHKQELKEEFLRRKNAYTNH